MERVQKLQSLRKLRNQKKRSRNGETFASLINITMLSEEVFFFFLPEKIIERKNV